MMAKALAYDAFHPISCHRLLENFFLYGQTQAGMAQIISARQHR